MNREIIDAIVKAAEREEGIQNIHMIRNKRSWHRCIWSYREKTLFLYNDNTGTTKAITIK